MTIIRFIIYVIFLISVSSCATTHFVTSSPNITTGLYQTDSTIDNKEIREKININLQGYDSICLISVAPLRLNQYFINIFRATNTVKKFYDRDSFSDYLINQGKITSGSISDTVGLYLLSKQIGNFLVLKVDCESDGQITTLSLRVIDPKKGETVLLIQRACTTGTGNNFDSLLIYPVVNEFTNWFRQNNSKG